MLQFLTMLLVSMMDPIGAAGALVAGLVLRQWWAAVLVAVIWRAVIQLALAPNARGEYFVASLIGAALTALIVWAIRRARRKPTPA